MLLLGTPLDFRLNFGESIPAAAKVVRIDYEGADLDVNRAPDVGIAGDIGATLAALAGAGIGPGERQTWVDELRQRELAAREKERAQLESDADPIHPMRILGECMKQLERDAIVVGDGGDFVSCAGRVMPAYLPGHWLDPGPFGALGMGPGQAMAAKLAHPDKQVLLLLGDGAFGFAAMEFDTMVRHRLPVVAVMGNNASWGLEKIPMEALYGYSVAADLNPGARYDKVVEALGGHGELVTRPDDIGPAIKRAFDSGLPALVNVVCDPSSRLPATDGRHVSRGGLRERLEDELTRTCHPGHERPPPGQRRRRGAGHAGDDRDDGGRLDARGPAAPGRRPDHRRLHRQHPPPGADPDRPRGQGPSRLTRHRRPQAALSRRGVRGRQARRRG